MHSHPRPLLRRLRFGSAVAACSLLPLAAVAADAGMQLQQPVPPQPLPSEPAALPPMPTTAAGGAASAGTQVTIREVRLEGNTQIDTPTLLAALGPTQGLRLDLAGLQALAQAVTAVYRERGYPFTQAVLPPQDLSGGRLTIRVVEGVYGRIVAGGEDPLAPDAQPFLDHELQPGDPIRSAPLERAMLLLNDQPGFSVRPVLRPGEHLAEGDLQVGLTRRNRWSGELGLDNAGSRATGEYRARATVSLNSPWTFGERLTATALVTDQSTTLGAIDYERPLGGFGLRGGLGAARTSYQLDGSVSPLEAEGRADVLSARLSHAAVRTRPQNLVLSANLQHKRLHDDYGQGLLVNDKTSSQLTLTAQFDRRDEFGGGGVTYGSVGATLGRLTLGDDAATTDAATARTAGSFHKWNLDLARIQRLPGGFSAYGRLSGQWTTGNLDASEKFGLGGFLGVRAYPLGEGQGDTGWLAQLELRRNFGDFTLFALLDQGQVQTNASPWNADSGGGRDLAGAGLGARWLHGPWTVESTVSTRTDGGPPLSDTADRRPRVFVVVGRRFD